MIQVVIVEDENHAAVKLAGLIQELDPGISIAAVIPSVKEAVDYFRKYRADLIFLDIQLSDGQSFEIFEKVKMSTPVIFTTAYNQYAIEAFKLNSVDYLLKPIRRKELEQSIRKYKETRLGSAEKLNDILRKISSEKPVYKSRFLVSYGQKMKLVLGQDIAFFYASNKAVFIRLFNGKDLPSDHTLDALQELVDPSMFFRINRKMIININAIKDMHMLSRSRIKLQLDPPPENDLDPVVSIERSKPFREWLEVENQG